MNWMQALRDKYPVETTAVANLLYGVYLWTNGDMTAKQLVGWALQTLILWVLGAKQRQGMAQSTSQNTAILTNQAAAAVATDTVDTELIKKLMAEKTAAHVGVMQETAKRMTGETPTAGNR